MNQFLWIAEMKLTKVFVVHAEFSIVIIIKYLFENEEDYCHYYS